MTPVLSLLCAAVLSAQPAGAPAASKVLPSAKPLQLSKHLTAEQPTVFVFLRPSSSLEREFARGLREAAGPKVGFREVHLTTGAEAAARQYEIVSTPTALVYDRRGRLVGRSADAGEISGMVSRAAQVMRIDWAEPGDPRLAETEKILGRAGSAGIMRTMSLRPEWLRQIHTLHRMQHQPNTALDRRTKELIATHVSALNRCKF